MQAFILAGGEGLRLRPLTNFVPKPMVPISGRPLLERIINHLKANDINKILILTGYLGNIIQDYFDDGSKFGIEITYSHFDDWKERGAGKAIIDSKDLLEDKFLVYCGDVLCNMNLKKLVEFHIKNKGIATLPLLRTTLLPKYSYVELNNDSTISKFHIESPTNMFTTSEIFLMNKEIFDFFLDPEERVEDTLTHAMKSGRKVFGNPMDCYWYHIQNWTDLEIIKRDVAEGKLKLEF